MKLSPSLMHNRPTRPIDATTRQQISVYSILIGICLLVPRTCNKNCTAHFSKCGGYKIFFRSLRSRITFCPPTFKTVAPPPWLACWNQAQKAQVQIAAATVSGNSLRQTAHTHCASVHSKNSSPLKGCGGNSRPGGK